MSKSSESVTIREASRRFGVSDTAVRNEIFNKKTNPNGCLRASVGERKNGSKTNPVLDWDMAYAEWTKAGRTIKNQDYFPKEAAEVLEQMPALTKQIKENIIKTPATANKVGLNSIEENALGFKSLLTPNMNPYQADSVKSMYEAGIKELAYLKLLGSLVPVDRVRYVLFNYGKTIKDALLQIPARIASDMRNAKSDREAQDILYKEFEALLFTLAQGPTQSMAEDAVDEVDEVVDEVGTNN